jgi:hypothetical protein
MESLTPLGSSPLSMSRDRGTPNGIKMSATSLRIAKEPFRRGGWAQFFDSNRVKDRYLYGVTGQGILAGMP